jgi:hypothetical protein
VLGHRLAVHVTPADEQECDRVAVLLEPAQEATDESDELVFVDPSSTGEEADIDAAIYGIHPVVVSPPRGEARVRAFAARPGRGAVLQLDGAIPTLGVRL